MLPTCNAGSTGTHNRQCITTFLKGGGRLGSNCKTQASGRKIGRSRLADSMLLKPLQVTSKRCGEELLAIGIIYKNARQHIRAYNKHFTVGVFKFRFTAKYQS